MKIMPLGDRVVIQNVGAEEQTKGGLYLATTAKEKPQMAVVLAVGRVAMWMARKSPCT